MISEHEIITRGLRKKPIILGVGLEKCGTTSLYDYLTLSERISAPYPKEIGFFKGDTYRNGLLWYAAHFDLSRDALLDCTPTYHWTHNTFKRIREAFENFVIFILLRNPMERCLSAYCHRNYWFFRDVYTGNADLAGFDLSLREMGDIGDDFVFADYVGAVDRVGQGFPSQRQSVLTLEQFIRRPVSVVEKSQEILNLALTFPDGAPLPRSNIMTMPRFYSGRQILDAAPEAHGLIQSLDDVYVCVDGFPSRIAPAAHLDGLRRMEAKWLEPLDEAAWHTIWNRYYEPQLKRLVATVGEVALEWRQFKPVAVKVVDPMSREAAAISTSVAEWWIRKELNAGREDGAVAIAASLFAGNPRNPDNYRLQAMLEIWRGRLPEAKAIMQHAIDHAPLYMPYREVAQTIVQLEQLLTAE